jgi:hypothetical protein
VDSQDVVAVIMEYMAKKFDEGDHGGRPVSVGAKREGWRARLFSSGSDTNTDLDEVSKLTKKGFLQRISSIRKYVRSPKTRQKSESCASSTDDVSVVKESSAPPIPHFAALPLSVLCPFITCHAARSERTYCPWALLPLFSPR